MLITHPEYNSDDMDVFFFEYEVFENNVFCYGRRILVEYIALESDFCFELYNRCVTIED